MSIIVVDYGAGNIKSLSFALLRIGATPVISKEPRVVESATRLIIPGVGHAGAAMKLLERTELLACIKERTCPVLGICVGMQLLFDRTDEGNADCFGIIPGCIRRFSKGKKIPHVGWNQVRVTRPSRIFKGIEKEFFYFVHSFRAPFGEYSIASTQYENEEFASAVERDNFIGVQFHPEKSGETGEKVLKNFLGNK